MMFKAIKESLPWLVPSAAIVFAASGYWERSDGTGPSFQERVAEYVGSATHSAPRPQAAPVAVSPETLAPSSSEASVTRSSADLLDLVPVGQGAALAATTPAPEPVVPAQKPVAPPPKPVRQAALDTGGAGTSFQAGAAFRSNSEQQCKEDLRAMASEARVYFPSGGVTADQDGIEQGKLLGLIAQSCPGVQIRVEGHSDPSGDRAANLRLSKARAEVVIKRIGASGIDTSMFTAQGFGDRIPSGITGPESSAYYDRRVQFSLIESEPRTAVRAPVAPSPWVAQSCVQQLQQAASSTALFYSPGSVSLPSGDLDTAMDLAVMAMECPYARLRVIGHHGGDVSSRETVQTGMLRAKALMAMLVGRGAAPEQIIISAPSRPRDPAQSNGLPGSRVNFDVILEES